MGGVLFDRPPPVDRAGCLDFSARGPGGRSAGLIKKRFDRFSSQWVGAHCDLFEIFYTDLILFEILRRSKRERTTLREACSVRYWWALEAVSELRTMRIERKALWIQLCLKLGLTLGCGWLLG